MAIAESKVTCSRCPLQIEGQYESGLYFYFRSRFDQWSLTASLHGDAVGGVELGWGADRGATPEDALVLIESFDPVTPWPKWDAVGAPFTLGALAIPDARARLTTR